ncbi:hypothetical protein SCUCBS95973_002911 [Sporothrix curviconia]|uniref:Uncharacterized protein n=1 Tax=Sporothrix curviconia TaxID=1260050 RepID=A0ABP0BAV0_9PEZI
MSASTPPLREKRDFYTDGMFEEAALRSRMRIPGIVRYTPVVLLPRDQCVFQTADQVKHMLDLTYDPEVKDLSYDTYWVDVDGKENCAVVVRSLKKKPNKAGKVLNRRDDHDEDKQHREAEIRHPDFYQMEAQGATLDERLVWLRREYARRQAAEANNDGAVSKEDTAKGSAKGKGKGKENMDMGHRD